MKKKINITHTLSFRQLKAYRKRCFSLCTIRPAYNAQKPVIIFLTLLFLLVILSNTIFAARIKDIATIDGVTGVQVIGYGLVSGLNNTGDNQQSSFTVQSVKNMLKRFGLTVPETNPRIRNVAAVMVSATIPTFTKRGGKVDVVVSSIGDARSLQGGLLIMTPLSASDGTIVGMAQGPVSVGGYDYQSLGSRVGRNFVTTGRVPSGLILEVNIEGQFMENEQLNISLRDPDFSTASNMANIINTALGQADAAIPLDAATVQYSFPAGSNPQQRMALIAQIESLNIQSDPVARVIINERTGTVVVGGNVELLPAVVAHGGLEIQIQKQIIIPQPAPFTIRPPQPVETAALSTSEQMNQPVALDVAGPTVQDMAAALNALKVSPRDLIAIFQALKEAGSLQGELIIQ